MKYNGQEINGSCGVPPIGGLSSQKGQGCEVQTAEQGKGLVLSRVQGPE